MKRMIVLGMASSLSLLACNSGKQAISQPEETASVVRSADGYTLKINREGRWNIFRGTSESSINWNDTTVLQGGESLIVPCPYPEKRLVFALINTEKSDTLYLSEKHLPMDGTPNFRDLGGMVNRDGRQLRWGIFFRSGALNELSEADLSYFKSLNIAEVVDLRSDSEIASAPDCLPDSTKWQQVQIINPADMSKMMESLPKTGLTPELATAMMVESNKQFVKSIRKFQPIIDGMLNGKPFLFHCTAGKDRTGMAAALILMALNVDRAVIMNDYLLSNTYTIPYYEKHKDAMGAMGVSENLIPELGGVKPEYLQAAFNTIDSIYGSSDAMLEKEFGLTPEKRQQLIEKYSHSPQNN